MDSKVQFIKESAPHIRRKDSLNRMMMDVVIGLLPVVIFAFIAAPLAALRNLLVSIATMELAEFIFVLIMNRILMTVRNTPSRIIGRTRFPNIVYPMSRFRLSQRLSMRLSCQATWKLAMNT